jgi:methylmalonyl-CoA carboxyltransferase large subunit
MTTTDREKNIADRISPDLSDLLLGLAERQQATEQQLSTLAATVKSLETRLAELSRPAAAAPTAAQMSAPTAKDSSQKKDQGKEEEITPEILVVIAAAVTVFLGKKVRIRSAKMLQSPYEVVNPWAQQGRVFVQVSHNLR